MRKQFSLENHVVIMNFSSIYCDTSEKILNSLGFHKVLTRYIDSLKEKESSLYFYLKTTLPEDHMTDELIRLFKFLLVLKLDEINEFQAFLKNKVMCIHLIEDFYNDWRKLERYTLVFNKYYGEGIQKTKFIEANNHFSNLVLTTYRTISEKIIGSHYKIYRQLAAGGNAGLILNRITLDLPKDYPLNGIPFIESIILNPPFITYPKQTTRNGVFQEIDENPIRTKTFDTDKWFCYPARIGCSLTYIYFHKDFIGLGVPLGNLFELEEINNCRNKKPDLILIFGLEDEEAKTVFYCDSENQLVLGVVSYDLKFDYFGYMKKMALTIHNIRMIEKGALPIHGAMVTLTQNDESSLHIVIIGDSGAGKSETLEALRVLNQDSIKDLTVIYDDMGSFVLEDGQLRSYGTEIGAFIRLDDLDIGYAYREIDRSIFMNPDKVNARLVIPVSTYSEIMKGVPVDFVLYANNYELGQPLEWFKDQDTAITVFQQGRRMAKGTTTENGIVDTFFANPFGPVQRQAQTKHLIETYFTYLFDHHIPVGQIRTQLGIQGMEHEGPKQAAIALLAAIKL